MQRAILELALQVTGEGVVRLIVVAVRIHGLIAQAVKPRPIVHNPPPVK
jgi:hypothetical protein